MRPKRSDRTLVGRSYAKAPNVKLRIPLMEGELPKSKDKPESKNLQSGSRLQDDLPAPVALPPDSNVTPTRGDLPDFSPVEPRPAIPTEEPMRTTRPELMTNDKTDWRAPAANIPRSSDTPKPAIRPPNNPNQFQLVDIQNRTRNVPAGRANEVVLLDFMTTTCLPCTKMIPTLVAIQEKYGAKGLDVMAVTCDEESLKTRLAYAERYRKKHDLNYQIYAEPGEQPGLIRNKFKVDRFPTVVLIDNRGEVLWQGHPSRTQELVNAIEKALRI